MANNGQSNEALGFDLLDMESGIELSDNHSYSKKIESERNKDLILENSLKREIKFSDVLFRKGELEC